MSEKPPSTNDNDLRPEEVQNIVKLTKKNMVGADQPKILDSIFRYKKDDFVEHFGLKNIDQQLKEKIIKNLETEIKEFEIKLINLKKLKDDSFRRVQLDKMIGYIIDIEDTKNSIVNREDLLDILIGCN